MFSSENTTNECRNALRSLLERRVKMNKLLFEDGLSLLSIPNFPSLGEGRFLDSNDQSIIEIQESGDLTSVNESSRS